MSTVTQNRRGRPRNDNLPEESYQLVESLEDAEKQPEELGRVYQVISPDGNVWGYIRRKSSIAAAHAVLTQKGGSVTAMGANMQKKMDVPHLEAAIKALPEEQLKELMAKIAQKNRQNRR